MNVVFLPGGCVDDVVATLIRGSASAVVTPGGAAATSALSFSNSSVHSTAAMGLELMCCLNLETDFTLSWITSNTSSFQLLLNSLDQNNNAKMLEMLYLANRSFRVTRQMWLCLWRYAGLFILNYPISLLSRATKKEKSLQPLGSPTAHRTLYRKKQLQACPLGKWLSCICLPIATSCSS